MTRIIRYIKPDETGWLWVKIEDSGGVKEASEASRNGNKYFLCENTKIQIYKEDKRIYFKVLDSNDKGIKASLNAQHANKYISRSGPNVSEHGCIITVEYNERYTTVESPVRGPLSQMIGVLNYNNLNVKLSVSTDNAAGKLPPLPTGSYNILAPDYPHNGGYTSPYKAEYPTLKCDQVWFPIEYESNNRYVHVGAISAGCMTILEIALWNDLYNYLISQRDKTGKYIGVLHIKNLSRN